MQKQSILLLILGCILSFAAIAMEQQISPANSQIKQKKMLNKALPSDAWNIVASNLSADTEFFSELARQVRLDEENYQRLVRAFLVSFEQIPEARDINALIKQYFGTFKYDDYLEIIKRLILENIAHPIPCQSIIESKQFDKLETYLRHFGLSFVYALIRRNSFNLYITNYTTKSNIDRHLTIDKNSLVNLPTDKKFRYISFIDHFLILLTKSKFLIKELKQKNATALNGTGKCYTE